MPKDQDDQMPSLCLHVVWRWGHRVICMLPRRFPRAHSRGLLYAPRAKEATGGGALPARDSERDTGNRRTRFKDLIGDQTD